MSQYTHENLLAREKYDPLRRKDLRTIRDWDEWLNLWNANSNIPILTGLLHDGFDVKCEDPVTRAIFYLRIADGHTEYHRHEINPGHKPEDRDVIKHKAFCVLCSKFFSNNKTRMIGDTPHWQWIAESMELLKEIIRFFRLEWKFEHFENLRIAWSEKEPATRKAIDFLWCLCHEAFEPKDNCVREHLSQKARKNLQTVRPRLIPIVQGLGQYDLLIRSRYGTTKEIILPLVKFVKQTFIIKPYYNRFANLKEAVSKNSPIALTLIQLLAMYKAQKDNPLWRV